ncbi:MAG: hypothetical protein DRN25_02060 [Thermoplasmata archaeon]|nr:MAG: hypothetical protein DRN25_02060 [Thermoplasmata archaeon]
MVLFKRKRRTEDREENKEKFLTYSDAIRRNIESYVGPHSIIIKFAPDFFELMLRLYKKNLPSPYKEMVRSVISYFVLPDDLLPESEMGPYGYLDDLYLCAYVIKKFEDNEDVSRIIKELWTLPVDVFMLSSQIVDELQNTQDTNLREVISSILEFTGIEDLEKKLYEDKRKTIFDIEKTEVTSAHRKKITHDEIDYLIKRCRKIREEMRKISFSTTSSDDVPRDEEKEKVHEDSENEDLLQNKIPPYVIVHLAKKAKYNNILTKEERKALFDIGKRKMENRKLTDKQIHYLEVLIRRAIYQGIVDAPCEDDPCDMCEILRDALKEESA